MRARDDIERELKHVRCRYLACRCAGPPVRFPGADRDAEKLAFLIARAGEIRSLKSELAACEEGEGE